jgi:hypothetical protein
MNRTWTKLEWRGRSRQFGTVKASSQHPAADVHSAIRDGVTFVEDKPSHYSSVIDDEVDATERSGTLVYHGKNVRIVGRRRARRVYWSFTL